MHRWHMPSYLLPVALAHDVLRFPNLIPDTAVPMKSITTRTRSVTCQIGGSLSSPASTLMSPHSPQILNRNLTSPLRSVQQSTRVLPPATRLSSLLTKFCSLATNSWPDLAPARFDLQLTQVLQACQLLDATLGLLGKRWSRSHWRAGRGRVWQSDSKKKGATTANKPGNTTCVLMRARWLRQTQRCIRVRPRARATHVAT